MGFPLRPKATPEAIAKARELRANGETLEYIARQVGHSINWAARTTKDIERGKIRWRQRTVFKNLPLTDDPVLRRRILNLAKRGFDVPPSRQAEWDMLGRKQYTVAERREIMRLE